MSLENYSMNKSTKKLARIFLSFLIFVFPVVSILFFFPGAYLYFTTIYKDYPYEKTPSIYFIPNSTKNIQSQSDNELLNYNEINTGPIFEEEGRDTFAFRTVFHTNKSGEKKQCH